MSNKWIEWHGGECPVEKGALVDVRYRDGVEAMAMPALTFNIGREDWRVCVNWKHENNPRDIIAYRLHQSEQEEAPMTIEQLLTKANKHAGKAQEHREKAAKHERKVDEHEAKRVEFVEKARQLMPGYTLEISADWERDAEDKPAEDMTDPSNWKEGDVVECVRPVIGLTNGEHYVLRLTDSGAIWDEGGDVRIIDDDGDEIHYHAERFKWISRPQ